MARDGLAAEGARVRLRPARADDAPVIEGLLSDCGTAGEVSVICRAGEDAPIGVIQYRSDGRAEGRATITWVVLVEGERRWGLGQDAVRLFEEAAARLGVRAFRTSVPASLGLALYFWLRLGYRPFDLKGETKRSGTLGMVRDMAG